MVILLGTVMEPKKIQDTIAKELAVLTIKHGDVSRTYGHTVRIWLSDQQNIGNYGSMGCYGNIRVEKKTSISRGFEPVIYWWYNHHMDVIKSMNSWDAGRQAIRPSRRTWRRSSLPPRPCKNIAVMWRRASHWKRPCERRRRWPRRSPSCAWWRMGWTKRIGACRGSHSGKARKGSAKARSGGHGAKCKECGASSTRSTSWWPIRCSRTTLRSQPRWSRERWSGVVPWQRLGGCRDPLDR